MPSKPKASRAGQTYGRAWQHRYGRRWGEARRASLAEHPVCVGCGRRAAEQVDHIEPHRGDVVLFWDPLNWQPLCSGCHGAKTASGR